MAFGRKWRNRQELERYLEKGTRSRGGLLDARDLDFADAFDDNKSTSGDQWVYFIQHGNDGPIKIGISSNPRSRLKSLQTAHTTELVLLAVESGGRAREQELHRQFAHLRISREWFEADYSLLGYIANLQK